jgi:hypothetical protein
MSASLSRRMIEILRDGQVHPPYSIVYLSLFKNVIVDGFVSVLFVSCKCFVCKFKFFTGAVLAFERRLRKCSSIVYVFIHFGCIRHVIDRIAVNVRSHHVISSHLISSLRIMSLHIIKCHIISRHTTITSHHIISLHHITSLHIIPHCASLLTSLSLSVAAVISADSEQ